MINKTAQILFNTVAGFGFLAVLGAAALANTVLKNK
jgi:hypothetical protein